MNFVSMAIHESFLGENLSRIDFRHCNILGHSMWPHAYLPSADDGLC